mmetsp:Transcript_117655/g.374877  ORF Transcript_117655/g.374877 Transcript_117655/m.374877 type:complete len:274 (-) Transcript_117655:1896-2717(-)
MPAKPPLWNSGLCTKHASMSSESLRRSSPGSALRPPLPPLSTLLLPLPLSASSAWSHWAAAWPALGSMATVCTENRSATKAVAPKDGWHARPTSRGGRARGGHSSVASTRSAPARRGSDAAWRSMRASKAVLLALAFLSRINIDIGRMTLYAMPKAQTPIKMELPAQKVKKGILPGARLDCRSTSRRGWKYSRSARPRSTSQLTDSRPPKRRSCAALAPGVTAAPRRPCEGGGSIGVAPGACTGAGAAAGDDDDADAEGASSLSWPEPEDCTT